MVRKRDALTSKEPAIIGVLVALIGILIVVAIERKTFGEPEEPRYFVCVGFDDSKYKVDERELAFNDGAFILGQGMAGGQMYDVYIPIATLVGCGAEPE